MSNPQVSGQDLIDSLRIKLGLLSNAFTTDMYLEFINDGAQEVWSVVKDLDEDYFGDSSQDTDTSKDDYLIDFSPTTREYNLPTNCREIRAIEVLTSGFENRVFTYKPINNPTYQQARRDSTANGPSGITTTAFFDEYYYTVFGNQLQLAQFPEAILQAKLWYIAAIDLISVNDFPSVLFPFNRKIIDFAAQKAMLSMQNLEMTAAWLQTWKESVKTLAMTTGPRSSTNAIYIEDYLGG